MSNNCLTIQNRVDYYLSLRTYKDISTLQEALQTPKSRDNAESVHLLLHNAQVCQRDRAAFSQLLQGIGQLPLLRQFSLSFLHTQKMPASALALLLRHAKHLQVLHLSDISLQESPYQLAEVFQMHPTLHTLQMVRCYCSPVHVLLQALSRMPRLKHLSLDGSILAQQKDADALAALAAVGRHPSLQSLHLEELEETTMSQPLMGLLEALQYANPGQLTELSFHLAVHESMPWIVVRALAGMLLHNRSLQVLQVPWTGGGEIWLPILEALAVNQTLREFRLLQPPQPDPHSQQYCLSHHFLQRAATMLRDHNTQLRYFWYDSWESVDLEIDLYMKSNLLGRGHLVHYDNTNNNPQQKPTHEEWAQAVVASRDHAHVSYYWLSQNPSLLVESAVAQR